MGTLHHNGLHWNSPVASSARPQYTAGRQFASAFILAAGDISCCGGQSFANGWQDQVNWILQNTSRTGEIVLRLFWPAGNTLQGDPGQELGQAFYHAIVQPAIDVFGIRIFQVLNEMNLEYEPDKPRSALAGDMANIAFWIKHEAHVHGRGGVSLGFPGPGGDPGNPTHPGWNNYWNGYASAITNITEHGPAYDWLAPHAYEFSDAGLADRMKAQYDSLAGRFPGRPHRCTEYGIPLEQFRGSFHERAAACRNAIRSLKHHVESRPGPDVPSVFYYLAFDSDAPSQAGLDARYELVADNADLGPAQILADAF